MRLSLIIACSCHDLSDTAYDSSLNRNNANNHKIVSYVKKLYQVLLNNQSLHLMGKKERSEERNADSTVYITE